MLCAVDIGLGQCPSHPQRVTSSAVIAPTQTSTQTQRKVHSEISSKLNQYSEEQQELRNVEKMF